MIENFILFPVLRNKEVIRSFLLFNFSFLDIYLKFNFILINLSSHQIAVKRTMKIIIIVIIKIMIKIISIKSIYKILLNILGSFQSLR